MRVVLITAGTRGDTQPMVVLGRELMSRGHTVVVGASPNTLGLAERAGLPCAPFGPDSQQVLESTDGRRWLASGDVKAFMSALGTITHEAWPATVGQIKDICRDADLIVAGILAEDAATCIAEAAGIPVVGLHSAPYRANPATPGMLVTTKRLPGPLNTLTGRLFESAWWRQYRPDVNVLRLDLGLAPTKRSTPARMAATSGLELQAYSPNVVPGVDGHLERRPVIGFLLPDEALRTELGESGIDAGLDAWLTAGDPPVFFGFGSMPVADPDATVAMLTAVTSRLGRRALISAGWGGLAGDVGPVDTVRCVAGSLDHERLLPRCAAAVHHGGSGTIAASTRAGIPTVVCSLFADQSYWASRVDRMGVGAGLAYAGMNGSSLEAALRRALQPPVIEAAQRLGERMRSEPPAAPRAAALVEAVASGTSAPQAS